MKAAAQSMPTSVPELSDLEKKIINRYQKGLPLSTQPYADMAAELGISQALLLQRLKKLQDQGVISRIGPVFRPHRVGVSTLAAMKVPAPRLNQVAALISRYPEVNHNYEREHAFNLWFVITARDQDHLQAVIADMEAKTGLAVMSLPLEKQYHIDLGFPLWC